MKIRIRRGSSLLPAYVFIVGFIIRAVFFLEQPYWYDEIVFISFSKQSFDLLLDTLTVEPHPPGFFLFLRLIPTENVFLTRLTLLIITYGLFLIGLLYGYATKLIQKYNLHYGLALFFASYTFLETTMYVKDGAISVPLSFLVLITMLQIIDKKDKKASIREVALPYIFLTLLFFLSYTQYLFMSIIVAIATYISKRRMTTVLLFSHMIIVLGYMGIHGYQQIIGNGSRSIWLLYRYNSPIYALQRHIGGYPTYAPVNDAVLVIYTLLLALSTKIKGLNNRQALLRRSVFVVTIALLIIAYVLHLLPQLHYAAPVFILLSIIAGWGMAVISYKKHIIALSIIALVFFASFVGYKNSYTNMKKLYTNLEIKIEEKLRTEEETGIVSDFTLMPYVTKIGYFNDDNRLIPMQVVNDKILSSDTITKEHLSTDIIVHTSGRTAELVRKRLTAYKQEHILYLMEHEPQHYSDPEYNLLKVLTSACSLESLEILIHSKFLYEFDRCSFEVSLKD